MAAENSLTEIFGCDIGNGYAYISLLQNIDSDPKPMFPINSFQLEKIGMPTSAYIQPPDGHVVEVFDGRPACDKHKREADKFIHAIKTHLKNNKEISVPGISKTVSPDRVYAAIVRDLVKQGNERRRADGKKAIYRLAFAFPASFTEDLELLNRMQNSIENMTIDGNPLKVVARLPEPAAVAIDYLYYAQNLAPEHIRLKKDSFTVLVYDLGHGTFDTAVATARSKGEPYFMHFKGGVPDVGGKDFDSIIYDEILYALKIKKNYIPQNSNEKEAIRKEAIRVKHELSDGDVSKVEISLPNGEFAEIEVTRKAFEEKTKHLIAQTMQSVVDEIDRAKKEDLHIDAIVLSGGASQMPMVRSNLQSLVEEEGLKAPIYAHRLSSAVSFGASRYGYWKVARMKSPILEQRTEYDYGIWRPSDKILDGEMQALVKSREKMPAESKSITLTSSAVETTVIRVYRSQGKYDTLKSKDNDTEIIRLRFEIPARTKFDLTMTVLDDYNIKLTCKLADGRTIVKSTSGKL